MCFDCCVNCHVDWNCFFDILSKISSVVGIFALLVALLFLCTPRLICIIRKSDDKNQIHIYTYNNNLVRKIILNLKCEIAISADKDFSGFVRTLDLLKNDTLCLKATGKKSNEKPNYIFKTNDILTFIGSEIANSMGNYKNNYKYIRVRLSMPNVLGITKVREIVIPVADIDKGICYVPKTV